MIIVVSGGRDFSNQQQAFETLDKVDIVIGGVCGVIEGEQRSKDHQGRIVGGADYWAQQWAEARGVPWDTMPADWKRWGPAMAGRARNQDMLRRWQPFALVAFPGNEGTADMVERARMAKVPVIEVTKNGLVTSAGLQ